MKSKSLIQGCGPRLARLSCQRSKNACNQLIMLFCANGLKKEAIPTVDLQWSLPDTVFLFLITCTMVGKRWRQVVANLQQATAMSTTTAQTYVGWRRKQAKRSYCRVASADSVNRQAAYPIHSSYKEKYAGLLHKEEWLSLWEIAHHDDNEEKEWFGEYMAYKRHDKARIMCLLRRHSWLSISNISGYDLDKIIFLWDIPSSNWATALEWSWQRAKGASERRCTCVTLLLLFINSWVDWRFKLISLEIY